MNRAARNYVVNCLYVAALLYVVKLLLLCLLSVLRRNEASLNVTVTEVRSARFPRIPVLYQSGHCSVG